MARITCTLTFPDGEKLTASAESTIAGLDVPIEYTGPKDRIPDLRETAPVNYLPMIFRGLAARHGALFESAKDGVFEIEE